MDHLPRLLSISFHIILISLMGTFCTSCGKKKAQFEITNDSNFNIDSLRIETHLMDTTNLISLKPGQTIKYATSMDGVGGDGAYYLWYHLNSKQNFLQFGYYTNGAQFEESTQIRISKDTVLFHSEFGNLPSQ